MHALQLVVQTYENMCVVAMHHVKSWEDGGEMILMLQCLSQMLVLRISVS
jgi:hypothetical protein